MSTKERREKLTLYMIAFAVGGLLGDVFFHTLPHMSAEHGHGHGHSHEADIHTHNHTEHHGHSHAGMDDNIMIVVGILTFFVLEKIVHSMLSHGHDKKEKDEE